MIIYGYGDIWCADVWRWVYVGVVSYDREGAFCEFL